MKQIEIIKSVVVDEMPSDTFPESITINRDTQGNVTAIVKDSKTITINYVDGEVVSFTDNEYLWEIIKTENIVTGVTVTKL